MTFLTVFAVVMITLLIVMAAMSIGVILGRKPIQGSCGGIGDGTGCSTCSNRHTCPDAQPSQTTAQAARQE
ncbi:MAG: (Na+)-NQR maturation NqrM [Pirellulaceae bacterium]|nr:(Na+)-NQR maturation NqrM [Pirellulaceae bacterium]